MSKGCSAAGYVTGIGVTINAVAGVTVSVCYYVSYGLLLISVDKLCGARGSARGCYQL